MADSCVREMDSFSRLQVSLHSSGHNYKPPERQLRLTATGRSILRRLARVAPSCGEPIHRFRSARTGRQSAMSAAFELSTRLRAETVQGKLIRSGESTAVALRHATYYCELFERTDSAASQLSEAEGAARSPQGFSWRVSDRQLTGRWPGRSRQPKPPVLESLTRQPRDEAPV
jgi:hypothetical protein